MGATAETWRNQGDRNNGDATASTRTPAASRTVFSVVSLLLCALAIAEWALKRRSNHGLVAGARPGHLFVQYRPRGFYFGVVIHQRPRAPVDEGWNDGPVGWHLGWADPRIIVPDYFTPSPARYRISAGAFDAGRPFNSVRLDRVRYALLCPECGRAIDATAASSPRAASPALHTVQRRVDLL